MRWFATLAAATAGLVLAGAVSAATIVGTAKNDRLRGTARADTLIGKGGSDRLLGLGGNDKLLGGPGNDVLSGGPGRDAISCGPGNDVVLDGGGDRVAADCEVVRGLPTVSVADAATAEGDAGPKTLSIPVTLSAPVAYAVTVAYATADGTATAPADYAATSGTLTFRAGETTKSVDVTVNGDRSFEPDESFRVTLSSPSSATIGNGSATATIQNDDRQPPRSGRYSGTTSQGNPISFDISPDLGAFSNMNVLVDVVCPSVGFQANDLLVSLIGAVPIDANWRFEVTIPINDDGVTGKFQLQGGLGAPGSASGFLRMDLDVYGVQCTTNNVTWSVT